MPAKSASLLVLFGLNYSGLAQDHPIEREIIKLIVSAQTFELPDQSEFVLESLAAVEPVTQEEIDRLRRLAPTDRSAANNLARVLSEKEKGGSRRRTEIFYGNEHAWRINKNMVTHAASPYTDIALGRDGYWILTQEQLQIANDLESLPSDVVFNPETEREAVRLLFAGFTTGVAGMTDGDIEFGSIARSDTQTKISLFAGERAFLVEGEYNATDQNNAGSFRIDRVVLLDADGRPFAVTEYRDWRHHPALNIRLAHHRVTKLADGEVATEYRITHAGPLSHDISAVTFAPKPDGQDIFRGSSSYRSIIDHTRGRRSIFDDTTNEIIAEKSTRSSFSSGTRFVLGLLIASIGILTFIVVRKSKQGT